MAEKHLKKCSTFLVIREIQIKTTLRFHGTPVRMAKMKNSGDCRCWEDVDKEKHFFNAGGNASWYNHSKYQFGDFSENWILYYLRTQRHQSWAYTQKIPQHIIKTNAPLCS